MNPPLPGFIEHVLQMFPVYEAFPCTGRRLRPLARLPNRRGINFILGKVTIAENPLTTGMATGAYFKRVGMAGCNPFAFVSTFFFQLDQHTGGFLPGRLPVRVPKRYLREVRLVSAVTL